MTAVITLVVAFIATLAFEFWRSGRRLHRLAAKRYRRELVIHEHWQRWCHDARRSIDNREQIRPWCEPPLDEVE